MTVLIWIGYVLTFLACCSGIITAYWIWESRRYTQMNEYVDELEVSPRLRSSLELAERLLEEAGLACVPGEGFGRPGFLRLSFARPEEELREGLRRLQDFFAAL